MANQRRNSGTMDLIQMWVLGVVTGVGVMWLLILTPGCVRVERASLFSLSIGGQKAPEEGASDLVDPPQSPLGKGGGDDSQSGDWLERDRRWDALEKNR